jgi:hypothetical protein
VRSSAPSPIRERYTAHGDGPVTDNRTGLVWQQAEAPAAMTWEESLWYVTSLSVAACND